MLSHRWFMNELVRLGRERLERKQNEVEQLEQRLSELESYTKHLELEGADADLLDLFTLEDPMSHPARDFLYSDTDIISFVGRNLNWIDRVLAESDETEDENYLMDTAMALYRTFDLYVKRTFRLQMQAMSDKLFVPGASIEVTFNLSVGAYCLTVLVPSDEDFFNRMSTYMVGGATVWFDDEDTAQAKADKISG